MSGEINHFFELFHLPFHGWQVGIYGELLTSLTHMIGFKFLVVAFGNLHIPDRHQQKVNMENMRGKYLSYFWEKIYNI